MKVLGLILVLFKSLHACSRSKLNDELVIQSFIYKNTNAKKVSIAGSFNNWSADVDNFQSDNMGKWRLDLPLKANYYQYKLVVDGNWIPDPNNSWKINDGGDNF